jgi:hypothetical protein
MGDGTQVTSGAGDIFILSPEHVTLSAIATAGRAVVVADWEGIDSPPVDHLPANAMRNGSGRILDGTGSEAANVAAAALLLRAANGIGDGTAGQAADIDTAVGLIALATDSGDINLHNAGALQIGTFTGLTIDLAPDTSGTVPLTLDISPLAGATIADPDDGNSAADNLTIRTSGAMTIVNAVTNHDGGDLVLAAEGTNKRVRRGCRGGAGCSGTNGNWTPGSASWGRSWTGEKERGRPSSSSHIPVQLWWFVLQPRDTIGSEG